MLTSQYDWKGQLSPRLTPPYQHSYLDQATRLKCVHAQIKEKAKIRTRYIHIITLVT